MVSKIVSSSAVRRAPEFPQSLFLMQVWYHVNRIDTDPLRARLPKGLFPWRRADRVRPETGEPPVFGKEMDALRIPPSSAMGEDGFFF